MDQTAKLLTRGNKQVVLLPREVRIPGKEVFIRRRPDTGDVILSPKITPALIDSWERFFELAEQTEIPEDFMNDRS